MPSSNIAYTSAAAEVVSADAAWSNVTNIQGAPDGSSATVTLAGLGEASRVILCGPTGYGISLGSIGPQNITVTITASASDLTDTLLRAQLYNGTTAIGNLLAIPLNSATLAAFTFTFTAGTAGVPINRNTINNLRVGVSCVSDTGSNVAADAVGVVVSGALANERETRLRAR